MPKKPEFVDCWKCGKKLNASYTVTLQPGTAAEKVRRRYLPSWAPATLMCSGCGSYTVLVDRQSDVT